MRNRTVYRRNFLSHKLIFWLFRRDNSPVFEIAPAIFNKSNLPGENLSRIQTVDLATEYLLLQTLASAKYFIV